MMKTTDKIQERMKDINMGDVKLLDKYEKNAFEIEVKYLKSLDSDRLLSGFCTIGGVESTAERYGGWESSAIQGHTLGHYLVAVSQAYAVSKDEELKRISDHIVSVLGKCQNKESGYLAAIPENHYVKLEKGDTSGTWVPWYTMHKVMSGLISAYELTENNQALEIAKRLGDWAYSLTSNWTKEIQETVLGIEYGGMNDCLYRLYSHTKSEKHLLAAHSFDEISLFDKLHDGIDVLCGKHANTTIPKILGALRRYTVIGDDDYYLNVAENFWDIVVEHHTYITGGNSEWEHFGKADILDEKRTNCNCETCNTYNMLKLTRELFKITGKVKYADYYENTFINAILSSQNPKSAMTMYFQPMATGYFKVYSSQTENFWCCTGSGMESFSKLGDSIYFKGDNSLYVLRYTSSKLSLKEKGIEVTQEVSFPNVTLKISGKTTLDIFLRVPDWCDTTPEVKINGESVETAVDKGFIRLSGKWNDGDIIECKLNLKIKVYGLPDSSNTVAFKYGPWVLSADLGDEQMKTDLTGVNVTVPLLSSSVDDVIIVEKGSAESWLNNINENFTFDLKQMKFYLKGTNRDLVFSPHYKQHEKRYGIYFRLKDRLSD